MKLDVESTIQNRVILICGEEDYLRRSAMLAVRKHLIEANDEFDVETIFANEAQPIEWTAKVGTTPFLSDRRVLLVRNLLSFGPPEEKFEEQLSALPVSAALILVTNEDQSGDDEKRRKEKVLVQAWQTTVRKGGGAIVSCSIDSKGIVPVIRDEATALGKALAPQAAQLLADFCGQSLSRSLEELEKLAMFVGEANEIRVADIQFAVVPSREWSVFSLVDAVTAQRTSEAISQLRILLASAKKADEAAIRSILPNMSRQLKLIWQARLSQDAGVRSAETIPQSLCNEWPDKPNLAKEKAFPQRKAWEAARNCPADLAVRCLEEVADADARLRGILPTNGGYETMERLVLNCIAILREGSNSKRSIKA